MTIWYIAFCIKSPDIKEIISINTCSYQICQSYHMSCFGESSVATSITTNGENET